MIRELLAAPAGRLVLAALAVLVVAVLVGLAVLWPSGTVRLGLLSVGATERADVERVDRRPCPQSPSSPCQLVRARLATGPQAGTATTLTLPGPELGPAVAGGDAIRVVRNDVPGAQGVEPFAFSDFERRSPLYLLAAVFAVMVVALGRWKGLRSLVGLGLSLVLVTQFVVPAILEGAAPVLVALTGALAVMLVTVVLTHGAGVTSIAAVMGATVSLLATALLAVLFVEAASITGFASDEATLLQGARAAGSSALSLQGLLLAGIVVGALGVLDDVTVSQASTVMALRRADPRQGGRRLFGRALAVGRDHLSATVNTLVLAYVGAALPVLLVFETSGTTFGEALNREVVAGEVVAMLAGSIGLVLAVPLTTALATWLAVRVPPATLQRDGPHAHAH